ncbi:MAG: hypothetical protein PVG14_07000 [Anaerolineales bacterium]|jgi:hypothetical protein
MSEITDFRQVQRRIFQLMSFEDGLWDLLLGTIFMLLAIYPITRELLGPELNIVLFLILLALVSVGQLIVRYFVSAPRIGYVRPRPSRGLRFFAIFTIVMVLITFGLVVMTFFGPVFGSNSSVPVEAPSGRSYLVELIVVLVMGGLFSAMGYLFGVTRLYFYGWLLGLANLASVYMAHNAGWNFHIPSAIVAGIIFLTGFMLLVRFLRKYPVPVEGS